MALLIKSHHVIILVPPPAVHNRNRRRGAVTEKYEIEFFQMRLHGTQDGRCSSVEALLCNEVPQTSG